MKEKSIKAQAEEIHKQHRDEIKELLKSAEPDQKTLNAIQSVLSDNGIKIQSITDELRIKSDSMDDAVYSIKEQLRDAPKLG
jgi:outer membrane lipopolysaccharide assembly protein LptE/RlpB